MIIKIGNDTPAIHPTAFIHPTAEISGKVRIGAQASVWGGCILRGDVDWINIGEDCNIQDASVFHTSHGVPVNLEKGVTIGHRVVIHGGTVKSYSLIGMGAILLDHSIVEENCLIGAAALVKENGIIPRGQLAIGAPAKVKRPLTPEEIKVIVDRAEAYKKYAATYLKALQEAGFTRS